MSAPLALVLLVSASLSAVACDHRASPDLVARACEHQLAASTRAGLEAGRRPTARHRASERPGSDDANLTASVVGQAVSARLQSAEGQRILASCRKAYAEISEDAARCILAADTPVAINACVR